MYIPTKQQNKMATKSVCGKPLLRCHVYQQTSNRPGQQLSTPLRPCLNLEMFIPFIPQCLSAQLLPSVPFTFPAIKLDFKSYISPPQTFSR